MRQEIPVTVQVTTTQRKKDNCLRSIEANSEDEREMTRETSEGDGAIKMMSSTYNHK